MAPSRVAATLPEPLQWPRRRARPLSFCRIEDNVNPIKKSIPYGRHTLTLETGEIARQAGGAVMVSLDDTVVLVTAVARQDSQGRARTSFR